MELIGFAAWCFVVAVVGGLVGLVLGNLRLPLVVLFASTPAAGAGTNLAISAVAAATAAVAHLRAGRFNARLFAVMAPPSVLGAVVGGYASGRLPADTLLGVIAVVLLVSGVQLLRRPEAPQRDGARLHEVAAAGTGFAIGVLGGMVGLILGSLRMPALLRWVGEVPHRAVGTNLAVGVCVGVAGALAHLPDAAPDVPVLLVGAAVSVPGALLGARLTGRLSDRGLVRSIGVVLLVAAAATAAEAVA